MKRIVNMFKLIPIFLLSASVNAAFADSTSKVDNKSSYEQLKYHAITDKEKSELKQVTQIAKAFAESHLLGTGGNQSLTVVREISGDGAKVIIGEVGSEGYDPEAYIVDLQRINNKWKVIANEFGGWIGSNHVLQKIIQRMTYPYPSLILDPFIEGNGSVGYYKQFPNEIDKNETPISFSSQGSRYLTMDIINKHKTDGIDIGQVQKVNNQNQTKVIVYAGSENEVSNYVLDLSIEIRALHQMYCEFSLNVREFCFSTTLTAS